MSKISLGFGKNKAAEVKNALSSMKNETLLAISEEFIGEDAITGGEWVKVKHKTSFSKAGSEEIQMA